MACQFVSMETTDNAVSIATSGNECNEMISNNVEIDPSECSSSKRQKIVTTNNSESDCIVPDKKSQNRARKELKKQQHKAVLLSSVHASSNDVNNGDNKNVNIPSEITDLSGTNVEAIWTQCCFLLPKKRRLCNLARAPNSIYCGLHRPASEAAQLDKGRNASLAKQRGVDIVERIPCPLDPKHTIYRHNLESHLRICNAQSAKKEFEALPYFRMNCNSGKVITDSNDTSDGVNSISTPIICGECEDNIRDQDIVCPNKLADKIRSVFKNVVSNEILDPSEVHDNEPKISLDIQNQLQGEQVSFHKTRHAVQDVLILQQMQCYGLLPLAEKTTLSDMTFIELGAGRGMLGLAVSLAAPDANILLVERAGVRKKADKILKESQRNYQRVRMDIRHCFLPGLPGLRLEECSESIDDSFRPFVVVAKHLCGCATDMALNSLNSFQKPLSAASTLSMQISKSANGVAIATCCHHACNWSDYFGSHWLCQQGFTQQEFNILRSWSGWASVTRTSTERQPQSGNSNNSLNDESYVEEDNEPEHNPTKEGSLTRPDNLTPESMAELGFMVKRVLDQGRVEALRSMGFEASQVRYCDPKYSPECVLILARQPRHDAMM